MNVQSSMTCRQLYRLFGFSKKFEFEDIFDVLLYSISDYSDAISYPGSYIRLHYLPDNLIVSLYGKLQDAAQTKLESYLKLKLPYKSMLRIHTQMRALELKRKEKSKISLFHLKERRRCRKEISELENIKIPIEDVFGYLEYRANQDHISREELHQKFYEFAELYPANRV